MASQQRSPQKVVKKPSLSILSSSNVNRINNSVPIDQKKERIVSESTGLIKFSIKKPTKVEESTEKNKHTSTIPIFVPIDQDTPGTKPNEKDLLFQMASKQRLIMELKEQLKTAELELSELETKYNKEQNIPLTPQRKQQIKESIKKSTSILNFQQGKPSAVQLNKTQTQISKGFNQFTNNMQTTGNGLLSKGKEIWGSRIKKDIQFGQEFISQMFENNSPEVESDDSSLIEDTQFDYSVDFDMNHLNNINVENKLKGTLLQQLQEEEEGKEEESFDDVLRLSSDDENDYGGHATPI